YMQLGLAVRRALARGRSGTPFEISGGLLGRYFASLGFDLTVAQRRAVDEITSDMGGPGAMHRLLQGDVGCGKTVVAAAAALVATTVGRQTAVMAPTEILAAQHARNFESLLGPMGVETLSITGGISTAVRSRALRSLADGRPAVVTGTQALIEDSVILPGLGLCIIDEGHRFGVSQRERLLSKGRSPDVLVMTATPIPRSLALTIYGDLDITLIDEMPPGREAPETILFGESERERAYGMVREELERGGQGFVVFPVVEENEALDIRAAKTMASLLPETLLPGAAVAMIHGGMDRDELEEVMGRFAAGAVDLLVATTVIEVGIDIPKATIMVVENAERFGLAQLHQLRGRVGRGGRPSWCLLISGEKGTEMSGRRLRIMEETADGFRIAEEDLRMRGPGELMGVRQSGLPDLSLADLIRDHEIMKTAREEAFYLVRNDPGLDAPENRPVRAALERRWGGKLKARGPG
ncbi:ATP-dependent DNA helicase RecG, partial [Thermodesulfobacteriota bacterium]